MDYRYYLILIFLLGCAIKEENPLTPHTHEGEQVEPLAIKGTYKKDSTQVHIFSKNEYSIELYSDTCLINIQTYSYTTQSNLLLLEDLRIKNITNCTLDTAQYINRPGYKVLEFIQLEERLILVDKDLILELENK